MQDIFSPFIDTQLFLAIMMRPQDDTSVDYVKTVAQQVVNGQVRRMNLKSMRELILNKEAPSLKVHLNQKTAYVIGDQQREKEQLERWSQIYAKIQRNEPIEVVAPLGGDHGGETAAVGDSVALSFSFPWLPASGLPELAKFQSYSWLCCIWVRINASLLLFRAYSKKHVRDKFFEAKVKTFQEAHFPVTCYLDSIPDPSDANVDRDLLIKLYGEGAGLSYYHCDKRFFQVVRTQFQHNATPLQVIRATYGDLKWTPEEAGPTPLGSAYWLDGNWNPLGPGVPDPANHKLYYGIISVLNQCRACMDSIRHKGPSDLFDNLWRYYVSWVDLFEFCLGQPERRMDDAYLLHPLGTKLARDGMTLELSERATPWELFGTMDTRAFHAGDLPNLFHVLQSIPLWGEHNTPPYALAKLYQKSLPFACQRRHIIPAVIKNIQQKPVFWRFFAKLTWVMLAGLYPGRLAALQTCISMRELLRVRELCANKELFCRVISIHQPRCDDNVADKAGSKNGGPLIIWTIFRNHIIYMASHNPGYVRDFARHYVDWDYFERDVVKLSHIIRSFDVFADDPFAQARMQLSKTIKSPNAVVHRLRRKSLALSLVEHANETLEKCVLRTVQIYKKDLQVMTQTPDKLITTHIYRALTTDDFKATLAKCMETVKQGLVRYESALALRCKCNILNELISLEPEMRLTKPALSMMLDPAYGGILPSCLDLVCELVNVYNQKCLPACFRARIDQMSMANFAVFCYYVNAVAVLDKISFIPLDADTVKRTDFAMMHKKHHIRPGDILLPSVYDICIAICCEKICTVMNIPGAFGAKKISYDIERDAFVCSRRKHLHQKEEEDDEEEEADEDDDECDDLDVNAWLQQNVAAEEEHVDTDIFAHPESAIVHDLTADAATMKGKGSKKSAATEERKELRNQRRAISKIPCGQPVLRFNLRGRALIWGNTLAGRTQIMFCPNCATLHTYNFLLYSASQNGLYRCISCGREEIMHRVPKACAYCDKVTESQFTENTRIEVFCPVSDPRNPKFDPIAEPESCIQTVNLCKTHFHMAKKYVYARGTMPKKELWQLIRKDEEQKYLERANGIYKK